VRNVYIEDILAILAGAVIVGLVAAWYTGYRQSGTGLLGASILLYYGLKKGSERRKSQKNKTNSGVEESQRARQQSYRGTRIRITAKTRKLNTDRVEVSEMTVETGNINEAKDAFIRNCEEHNLEIVSEMETEIVD